MKAFILAVVFAVGLSTLAGTVLRGYLAEPAGDAFARSSTRVTNPAGVPGERFSFF